MCSALISPRKVEEAEETIEAVATEISRFEFQPYNVTRSRLSSIGASQHPQPFSADKLLIKLSVCASLIVTRSPHGGVACSTYAHRKQFSYLFIGRVVILLQSPVYQVVLRLGKWAHLQPPILF
jgi:hypothetical protein